MKKKILVSFIFISIISVMYVFSYAGLLDEVIKKGNKFDSANNQNDAMTDTINDFVKNDILSAVGLVGNLIFAVVTVILGMKYIWSGANGRAQVLESLPTFVVAVVFFYLADTIVQFVNSDKSLGAITDATNWTSVSGLIVNIVYIIVQFGSVAGIIVIGVRYMFASADGRAELKNSMGGIVIGILFVFSASNIVKFIVSSADSII